MIELIILAVVVAIVVILIRPGRSHPPITPLVIDCAGQFHATLAPQLNQALPLIEAVAQQLLPEVLPAGDSATLCFEIRDTGEVARGGIYLLGLTRRNGRMYFQAIEPRPLLPDTDRDTPYKVLQDYAAQVLVNIPSTSQSAELDERLAQAVRAIAALHGISARQLHG